MKSRVFIILTLVLLSLLFYMAASKTHNAAANSEQFLLEARLERSVYLKSNGSPNPEMKPDLVQTVAKVRFIARSNLPVSIFLPAGEKAGYAIAFQPSLRPDAFTATQLVVSGRDNWAQEFLKPLEKEMKANELVTGSTQTAAIGGDMLVVESGLGQNNAFVEYKAYLTCKKRIPPGEPKFVHSSVFRLDNEEIHCFNTAVPALMSASVTLENPQPIGDK
jgi:hypothetical protein